MTAFKSAEKVILSFSNIIGAFVVMLLIISDVCLFIDLLFPDILTGFYKIMGPVTQFIFPIIYIYLVAIAPVLFMVNLVALIIHLSSKKNKEKNYTDYISAFVAPLTALLLFVVNEYIGGLK